MALLIGTLAVVLLSIVLAIYQLITISGARREYDRRIGVLEPGARLLEYGAVEATAITLHLVVPGIRGFPSVDEYQKLTFSQQSLYCTALRERAAVAQFFSGTVAVVGAALVALLLQSVADAGASWWQATVTESSTATGRLWDLLVRVLILALVATATVVSGGLQHHKIQGANDLERAYRRAPGDNAGS